MRPGPLLALAALALAALALGACAGAGPAPASAGDSPTPAFAPGPGTLYRVLPGETRVVVRVLRGGSLAALGHNHTVAAVPAAGCLVLAGERARFHLRFRLRDLAVDLPRDRVGAGPDFAVQPDPEAVARTRRNMLGEAVLDAARFPLATLRGETRDPGTGAGELEARLTVRGVTRPVTLPVTVTRDPDGTLRARGEATLRQTEFGITPFQVMMGALRVQDALPVTYRLAATPAPDARPGEVCGGEP